MAAAAAMRRDIHSTVSHGEDVLLEELSSRLKGVLPVQPSPLMVPSDNTSSSLKSTILGGHLISCFVTGGECRLCFPQIISVVLQGVEMADIDALFKALNVHISLASQQQLDTLKVAGVMPMTADNCGLIRKSDAERLVAKLLPQSSGPLRSAAAREDAVPVCHDCFGGCSGIMIPSLPTAECIECDKCKFVFTGEKFVAHTHSQEEIRQVCHWGFDSANWKYYLRIAENRENDLRAVQRLEHFKNPHLRASKRQTDLKLSDSDGVPSKMSGVDPSLLELGQLVSQRAMMSLSNGGGSSLLNAAHMYNMSPQLQSLLALQFAAAASQLPLGSSSHAQPSQSEAPSKLGADTKLPPSQAVPPVLSNVERLVKPVPLKSDLNLSEESTRIRKKLSSSSELALNGPANPNTALSLDKLLEQNLKEPALSLAKLMLLANGRAEARRTEELNAQVEQLRRENCILRGALSKSNSLCIPSNVSVKVSTVV